MASIKSLRLGTRRSLLALAQSKAVAKALEKNHPQLKIELIGMDTQGDRITDLPLSKIEGKDFFVQELDQALLARKIDFCVHSMKDLSLIRPKEIQLAAVPAREWPHDVIFFSPRVLDRLNRGIPVRIGTSAPRRLENIPTFLKQALPRPSTSSDLSQKGPNLTWIELRGNVTTRLSRLHEPDDSPRQLDGVVLALAGLNRLWKDPESRPVLADLIHNALKMVLPVCACPSAPGQGAVAIECRTSDPEIYEIIRTLHSSLTHAHVLSERRVLEEWGGGCHQKLGATTLHHPLLGEILHIKGRRPETTQTAPAFEQLVWKAPSQPNQKPIKAWDGSVHRTRMVELTPLPIPEKLKYEACFVAHSRALPRSSRYESRHTWTSGLASWFALAEQGVWVEGCAEGMGVEWISPLLSEPVLALPELSRWGVLTHENAIQEWPWGRITPTYRIQYKISEESRTEVHRSTHFFWSSGSQFDALKEHLPHPAHHACGPGKTVERLRRHGVDVTVFPNATEWKKWIQT